MQHLDRVDDRGRGIAPPTGKLIGPLEQGCPEPLPADAGVEVGGKLERLRPTVPCAGGLVRASGETERIADDLAAAAAGDSLRRGFSRFLNRLLFCLVTPRDRWKIFRRFYRVLSEERIARFYAHRFTISDAARIVIGRPPSGLAPLRFARSFLSPSGPGLT